MFSYCKKYPIATFLVIIAGLVGCGDKEQPKPRTTVAVPPPVAPAQPPASSTPAAPPAAPKAAAAPEQAPSPAATAAAPQVAGAAAPAASAPPAPVASAPAAPPAQSVLASQDFSTDPNLRGDVLEVKRVSGGALLVKWRLSRPAAASGAGLAAPTDDKGIHHSFSWSGVYVTDPAENKKYSGLKDSQGSWIGQGDNKTYAPGQQQVMWMKFPAPPPGSTKISFVFHGFPPFDDLPVAQ